MRYQTPTTLQRLNAFFTSLLLIVVLIICYVLFRDKWQE